MREISPEKFGECYKAIKKCHWRKKVAGIYICAGVCMPCDEAMNKGKCDTLINLFRKDRK